MWGDIAITFLLAFITTYVFTPYSIRLARKVKALDIPKDKRKIHKKIISSWNNSFRSLLLF